jgi:large subunit ribosomal protein L4
MSVVDVKNLDGKTVGQMDLADAVYGAKVKPHLLHEVVRWYLAAQRAGTHKVKGRGEVRGSGKKLWRQKGTGRARVGSIRSPLWRHGGTVHGPVPRSYAYRIPRKVFLGALRSALSAKLADQKLIVVESWELESHKAKPFRQALDRLESRPTTLLVSHETNRNLELASRNLAGVKLVRPSQLQPYDLLKHDRLVLSKDAALKLGAWLAPKSGGEALVSIQLAPAAPVEAEAPAPKKRATRKKKE